MNRTLSLRRQTVLLILLMMSLSIATNEARAGLICESLFVPKMGVLAPSLTESSHEKPENFESLFRELDELAKQNPDNLLTWANTPADNQVQQFQQLEVVSTNNKAKPFELRRNGRIIFEFSALLGAGKRGTVYLTKDGRAVKILKQLDQPRELLLQAWTSKIWQRSGARVPQIYEIDPAGNYLVQEFIPGETVLSQVMEPGSPDTLKNLTPQILNFRKTAENIWQHTGLFFDLKAANFVVDPHNNLVFVDCGPRLDERKTQYYLGPRGERLSKYLFLEAFFFRQMRRESLTPLQAQQEDLLLNQNPLERLTSIIADGERGSLEGAHLAEAFTWSFKKEKLREFKALAIALWKPEEIKTAREQLRSLQTSQKPTELQLVELKLLRGRLKRLRSAFIAFSEDHQAPKNFDRLVTQLGKLRDTWKRNDSKAAAQITDQLIDILSSKNIQRIEAEIASFRIDSEKGFDRWLRNIRRELLSASQSEQMSAKSLHEVRKDISELLAIAELRYALIPNFKSFNQLSFLRYASIETGDWHDVFVINGAQVNRSYERDLQDIPEEMRLRFYELSQKLFTDHEL